MEEFSSLAGNTKEENTVLLLSLIEKHKMKVDAILREYLQIEGLSVQDSCKHIKKEKKANMEIIFNEIYQIHLKKLCKWKY